MYFLSITILQNDIPHPFFGVVQDFRWIYAISPNEPLLQNFKMKIESFIDYEFLRYMRIEILPLESATPIERFSNALDFHPYHLDKIYIEGIVNRNEDLCFTYDELLPQHFDFRVEHD